MTSWPSISDSYMIFKSYQNSQWFARCFSSFLKNADNTSFEIWVQQMKYLNINKEKKASRIHVTVEHRSVIDTY